MKNSYLVLCGLLTLTQTASAAGLYPMEGGNLRREHRSLSPSGVSNPLQVAWEAPACGSYGSPQGGPVILTDRVVHAFAGAVRCRDRATGAILWTWVCKPHWTLYATPTYDPDRDLIYIGTVQGDTIALAPSDGHVVWYYGHDASMDFINTWTYWQYSGVVYADGKIFIGTGGPGMRCIDPDTRATLWNFNFTAYFGSTYRSGTCTPAYDQGRLYFTTREGAYFCLDASNGSVVWYKHLDGLRQNTVLVTDTYVYNIVLGGRVECRNKSDGSVVWTQTCSGVTDGNLAICGEVLIVPGDSWRMWGLDSRNGRPLWNTKLTGNFARSSPFVICGKVYISACHGDYYSLDGQTGKIEWRYRHAAELSFVEWAEDSGQVFVCNSDGKMFCFVSQNPGNPVTCVCDLKGDWTPVPTTTPTWTPTMTPTPAGTQTGDCSGRICRVSASDEVRVFYDIDNAPAPNDGSSRGWLDIDYLPPASWRAASEIIQPPGEWTVPCTTGGSNSKWIGAYASGLPPTLADSYYRTEFTLPAGAVVSNPTFTLSGDNVVEAWLNGTYLGLWEGPYNGDSWLYTLCKDVTLGPALFREGKNVLSFRLVNQYTYHGLTFELCVPYQAPCDPGGVVTPVATPTFTPTATLTPTPTATWTPTDSPTATWTFTDTPTVTVSETPTSTFTPTATCTPTKGRCQPHPYPNPCRGDKVCFKVDGGPYPKVECKIYSPASRCVHAQAKRVKGPGHNDDVLTWDLKDVNGQDIANGLYIAVIKTDGPDGPREYKEKVLILR